MVGGLMQYKPQWRERRLRTILAPNARKYGGKCRGQDISLSGYLAGERIAGLCTIKWGDITQWFEILR